MHTFFDSQDDLDRHIELADKHIMPIIDLIDAGDVKYRTALFVIFTRRAIQDDGLIRQRAHQIIDVLFDALAPNDNGRTARGDSSEQCTDG